MYNYKYQNINIHKNVTISTEHINFSVIIVTVSTIK